MHHWFFRHSYSCLPSFVERLSNPPENQHQSPPHPRPLLRLLDCKGNYSIETEEWTAATNKRTLMLLARRRLLCEKCRRRGTQTCSQQKMEVPAALKCSSVVCSVINENQWRQQQRHHSTEQKVEIGMLHTTTHEARGGGVASKPMESCILEVSRFVPNSTQILRDTSLNARR